jgi:hypothetical protein
MIFVEQEGSARRYLGADRTLYEVQAEAYGYFAIMELTAAQTLGIHIFPALASQVTLYFQEHGYEPEGEIQLRLEDPFLAYDAEHNLLGAMCRVIAEGIGWPPAPVEPQIDTLTEEAHDG